MRELASDGPLKPRSGLPGVGSIPTSRSKIKERKKTSKVWLKFSDDEFKDLIAKSTSYAEILRNFDLTNKGCNPHTVKRRIAHLGIDTSHIALSNKGRTFSSKDKIDLQEILLGLHPSYRGGHLKHRLFDEGIKKKICEECGIGDSWNGRQLSLQLDHTNGISSDHRLENLKILCPNCHSQTPTFCGRNKGSL